MSNSSLPIPVGAYIGQPENSNAANEAAFEAEYQSFAKLLGSAPQFLDYFLNENEPVSAWAGNAQWAATSAASSPAKAATPVIALPLSSTATTLTVDQQYQAFASGQYDTMIQNVVKAWAQQGFTTQYWRPGWEMNIPSMPSYAGTDAQTQADWVTAFQHVSTVLHQAGVANGVSVQVIWNPSVTNYDTLGVLKNLYPGNAYVDVIGADIYADAYPYSDGSNAAGQATYHDWTTGAEDTSLTQWLADPVNRTHYWTYPAATKWVLDGSGGHDLSLQTLLDFAMAQGKPFALPETGAGNANGGHGIADDGAFPAWLAQTLQASGDEISFVNLWDSNGGGNFEFSSANAAKPQESAAWASYFGAGSLGTGSDTIALNISEDAYAGDAHFVVTVDAVQVGGIQVVTASHVAGAEQTFNLHGEFGTAPHTIGITFTNDAYGGLGLDRNLYVEGATYNGAAVPGAAKPLYSNGTDAFTVGAGSAAPSPTGSAGLVINVAEDAYQGDAQFEVFVDGKQVGGVYTATASHAAGQSQAITVASTLDSGPHQVGISFINDAYGGSPSTDRNLYVTAASYDGQSLPGAPAVLYANGTATVGVAVGSGVTSTAVLNVSEDAYQGDAQFKVSIDGQAFGGIYTATASHAAGQSQAFRFADIPENLTPHDLAVTFLNDAYGGSPSTDRNLYVSSVQFDGNSIVGAAASLFSDGTSHFTMLAPVT